MQQVVDKSTFKLSLHKLYYMPIWDEKLYQNKKPLRWLKAGGKKLPQNKDLNMRG